MRKLSDFQLAAVLDEVACAMHNNTSMVDSMQRLSDRRLGRAGRVAARIAERLEQGQPLSVAAESIESPRTPEVIAAIETAQRNGEPRLLRRLATLLRRRANDSSNARLNWFYPWLLLVISYLIAVYVMAPLILDIHGHDILWPLPLVAFSKWLVIYAWVSPLVIVFGVALHWMWLLGRHPFTRPARLSLFCQSLADQLECGVAESDAIASSARLAGQAELIGIEQPTLQSKNIADILSGTEFDQRNSSLTSDARLELVSRLRHLAVVHAAHARRRNYLCSTLLPRALVLAIGLAGISTYIIFVLAPVYRQVAQW